MSFFYWRYFLCIYLFFFFFIVQNKKKTTTTWRQEEKIYARVHLNVFPDAWKRKKLKIFFGSTASCVYIYIIYTEKKKKTDAYTYQVVAEKSREFNSLLLIRDYSFVVVVYIRMCVYYRRYKLLSMSVTGCLYVYICACVELLALPYKRFLEFPEKDSPLTFGSLLLTPLYIYIYIYK